MENAGFGVWAEAAASYTIPLYTAAPARAAPDEVRDALRYRGWRDAMIAHDSQIFDVVQSALPADVGDSRDPTAAEWDAALDAYLRTCATTPADSQKGEGDAKPLTRCAAARDGNCTHAQCPQLRDNEPHTSGRHCPLDTQSDEG